MRQSAGQWVSWSVVQLVGQLVGRSVGGWVGQSVGRPAVIIKKSSHNRPNIVTCSLRLWKTGWKT